MTCLVTGNRGFIGSNLMQYLVTQGHDPIGFDMLNDYPTVDVLSDYMKQNDVNKVYHLGARAFIPDCYGMQIGAIVNSNVVFTANLLMACKLTKIDRLVYLSTSEVYGNSPELPINENTPVNPASTYAATKLAAENLIRTFRVETGLDARILRHFNIYGPWDTQPRVIPKIMSAAKHNKILKMGRTDITRDFSYVTDVCIALENIMEFKYQEDFVRGSDSETSIDNLIDMISDLYKTQIIVEIDSSLIRPNDVFRLRSNSAKYNHTFPQHESIKILLGLQYTKEWYDKHDWKWEQNDNH
jgi:nucleoside-diphosphate-sugar epimerase